MKALHEFGAIGMMGSMAAYVVLVATAPADSLEGYAAVRRGIDFVCRWILVPSLVLTLTSGLLSIAFNEAYKNAGWAWFKAALGIIMFEGTLLTIQGSAARAAELSAAAVTSGLPATEALAPILRTEWNSLWLMLALCLANVVLAVWRPRFSRRRRIEPHSESTE
jgi:hypothetical protein